MVDSEDRGTRGRRGEDGGDGEARRRAEPRRIVAEDGEFYREGRWGERIGLEEARDGLKEALKEARRDLEKKLLGGKHKRELDEFFKEIEKKVEDIRKSRADDMTKFKRLKDLKEDKERELVRKIEAMRRDERDEADDEDLKQEAKEAKREERRKIEGMVKKVIKLKAKMEELEGETEEIARLKVWIEATEDEENKEKMRVELKRKTEEFAKEYNKVEEERASLVSEIMELETEEVDYEILKGKVKEKIGRLIGKEQEKLLGAKEVEEIKHKIKEFGNKSMKSGADEVISREEGIELIAKMRRAGEEGLISREEIERMEREMRESLERLEILEDLRDKRKDLRGKEGVKVTPEMLKEAREFNPKAQKLVDEDVARLIMLNDGRVRGLFEDIKHGRDPDEEVLRFLEKDSERIDESVRAIKEAVLLGNGKYSELVEGARKYVSSEESQLRPEKMLEDAKRDILLLALERASREEGELEVTEKDLREWVMSQMHRVVAGGEESTSYSARQFLSEVSGILEKSDLKFNELIEDMLGRVATKEGKLGIVTRYNEFIELDEESVNSLRKFAGGKHVERAEDNFREEISAAIVVNELTNAYNRSGSAEDMVRIMGVAKTDQLDWVLNMKSPEKEVKGRLSFYEVDVDKEGKRRIIERSKFENKELDEETVKDMHTAEINKGALTLVITMNDGTEKKIKSDEFTEMLEVVKDDLTLTPGDVMDILNQQRFAEGAKSRRGAVAEKFKKEAMREAIMKNMGVVNIDGEVNLKKIEELIRNKSEYRDMVGFKLVNKEGEDLANTKKLRVKMIMEQVGEKKIEQKHRAVKDLILDRDERTNEPTIETQAGGWRENDRGLDDMNNEFKMMFVLGEGVWDFTGLSIAHWNKDHTGESKDWHLKILHFVKYCQMYGIGVAHLRKYASLDYHDFITRRKTDILPQLFGKHLQKKRGLRLETKKEERGKVKWDLELKGTELVERKELINLLMSDRDGFVMSRQRMLEMLERARELEKEGKGKGDKFLRDILKEKAIDRFGGAKGRRLVDKHWDDIKEADWGKVIDEGEGGFEGLVEEIDWGKVVRRDWRKLKEAARDRIEEGDFTGITFADVEDEEVKKVIEMETKGFSGWYWFVKKNYTYANLNWGRGKRPGDKVWAQRLYKEAQYLLSADKYRVKWVPWLTGNPESINGLIDMIRTPGWYGQEDMNRKSELMLTKWQEYFTNRWVVPTPTTPVSPHDNVVLGEEKIDSWDGTIRYPEKSLFGGACLARQERGLRPYTAGQLAEVVSQFQRAGLMTAPYANEMRRRISEAGYVTEFADTLVGKTRKIPVLGQAAGLLKSVVFGFSLNEENMGEWWPYGEKRFPGLFGLIYKFIDVNWSDFRRSLGDIIESVFKASAKQAGNLFKEGFE